MFNFDGMMNGMFGKIAPGMCRVSMDGSIAIKTTQGYKTYNVENGQLINCDSFAFDIGSDFFFVIPTNHVKKGDIIFAGGKPRCVIEIEQNSIKVFSYEDSTISTIVPERHMFMGDSYFYGKIVSIFGNVKTKNGKNNIMKMMMMSQMFGDNEKNMNSLPMAMMFMNGGFDFNSIFGDDEEEEDKE